MKWRAWRRLLLQGSYRNVNKLAERVSAVMTDSELRQSIDDHYRGEAQLLIQGADRGLSEGSMQAFQVNIGSLTSAFPRMWCARRRGAQSCRLHSVKFRRKLAFLSSDISWGGEFTRLTGKVNSRRCPRSFGVMLYKISHRTSDR